VFIVKSFLEIVSLNYLDAVQDAVAGALVPLEGVLAFPYASLCSGRFKKTCTQYIDCVQAMFAQIIPYLQVAAHPLR
jgi:hypothetical protein